MIITNICLDDGDRKDVSWIWLLYVNICWKFLILLIFILHIRYFVEINKQKIGEKIISFSLKFDPSNWTIYLHCPDKIQWIGFKILQHELTLGWIQNLSFGLNLGHFFSVFLKETNVCLIFPPNIVIRLIIKSVLFKLTIFPIVLG